jgi:polyphosphate kinase
MFLSDKIKAYVIASEFKLIKDLIGADRNGKKTEVMMDLMTRFYPRVNLE